MAGRGSQAEIWERNILGTEKDKCRDVEGKGLAHRGTAKGQGSWCSWNTAEKGKEGAEGPETSSRVTEGRQGTLAHRDCTCKTEIPGGASVEGEPGGG